MPKHIKKGWPQTVGVRLPQWGDEKETWWPAYLKWKKDQGWGGTVSAFIREAINEKVAKLGIKKGTK